MPYETESLYNIDIEKSVDEFCNEIKKSKASSCFRVYAEVLFKHYKRYIDHLKQRDYGGMSASIYSRVLLYGLCNYYNDKKMKYIDDLNALIYAYEVWSQKWQTDYTELNKEYFMLMNQFYFLALVSQNVELLNDTDHVGQKTMIEKITAMQFRYESFWTHSLSQVNPVQCLSFRFMTI